MKLRKIAIIGSTGMLGQPVTKAFLDAGYDVTVLTRDGAKAQKIFGQKIKVVEGDLQNSASIRQVLIGQDAVYLNLSVEKGSTESQFQPERDGLDAVLSIAKEVGIRRVGYLSSLVFLYQGINGFYWWPFALKRRAVEQIRSSGLAYSIFYPSTFMESFERGTYRDGSKLSLSGESKFKMYLIAGSDYGRQVVKAFAINRGNNEYAVQGQEGYTADEAAHLLAKNYTKEKLKVVKYPLWFLKMLGTFNKNYAYASKIVDALNNFPEQFEAHKTWKDLGKPQIRYIDYIRKA